MVSSRFVRRIEEEKHTLAEAIDRYSREYLPEFSESGRADASQSTSWWRDELGALSLAALTPAAIADARAELLEQVSGPTSNRYLAVLSAVLRVAEKEWQWLGRNPVRTWAAVPRTEDG